MSVDAIWPCLACMAVLWAVVSTPMFGAADAPPIPSSERLAGLDGLRGFLALGVFFHHAVIYHRFLIDGVWTLPPSRFYGLLGQVGVEMFFMITGYLFWAKLLAGFGRPHWGRLFLGRLFRIGPLYLAAIETLFLIVGLRTGFRLRVPLPDLAAQAGTWLALGLCGSGPDLNGYADTTNLLAGVTWTLRFEWLFYLSLPMTALLARRENAHLPFAALGWAATLVPVIMGVGATAEVPKTVCAAHLFFAGMLCASLLHRGLRPSVRPWLASCVVLAVVAGVLTGLDTAYAALPMLGLALAFLLVAAGCPVFGLLATRQARRLGNVSFGLYLLHGLVLACVFGLAPVRDFGLAGAAQYWTVVLGCALLLLGIATLAHAWIERSGIELGRRLANRIFIRRTDRVRSVTVQAIV